MKKLWLVFVLLAIMAVGAFAERPNGWGIGVMWAPNYGWDRAPYWNNASLSLKAPQMPIYWGINAHLRNNFFGLNVTGDYYLYDQTIMPDINFGWYFGLGGYAGFYSVGGDNSYFGLTAGARAPIGVYVIPIKNFLEVFFNLAPSLGVRFGLGNNGGGIDFPAGGLGGELGVRIWL